MSKLKKIVYLFFLLSLSYQNYLGASLTIICGSMSSGKSGMFIEICRRYIVACQKIIIFKHAWDNRILNNQNYDPSLYVSSRSGSTIDCKAVISVEDMKNILSNNSYNIIAIDETQFFNKEEIINFVNELLALNKIVIIAGLDLDFKGETFGPMGDLLALADEVIKLKAICSTCKQDKFCITQRLINGKPAHYDDPLIMVGESAYEPRCRNCHKVLPAQNTQEKNKA